MSTVLSDHDILYSVLGGLQPGGTVFSWIAGLTACEALRLTQRFDENTSWDKRLFVYFSLVMSVTQAGLFAAMLYHYCIQSYGNYHQLLHITHVVQFHYIFSRIATCAGYTFYAYSVWASGLGKMKICKVPIIRIVTALLLLGVYVVIVIGIPRALSLSKFETVANHGSFGPWGHFVQLICGGLLTLLKAGDLVSSKPVREQLASDQHWTRHASAILCLMVQTAVFTTGFDLVTYSLRNAKGAGFGYSMMSLTAEIHLLGPIMAISATLQEDFLAEQAAASTCPIGQTECQTAVPSTTRRLTFQTQEKRMMKDY
ncbi:hypothetical protein PCANC_12764 [Puccinia coronata f. sp. avenae]|uniref:Uncharacterized protein n=1 Tax=Puccinia coronata f. sp. avenae TaxID=200324 RepID=A0A2N5TA18_9BASI|nr:hypothetical protein PCASD_17010 [Puccinia coronata f. sp. avenae]PLW46951.1 hypothetical protein PCASD_08148 [Puccinia coronata f. sp. avenae]PLW50221.1 hypothetical protein PCANC_12764 [Puccinia coronata f. sp. avenae]